MYHGGSGDLLAVTEQMLLHVDMKSAKTCPIEPQVYEALDAIWRAHKEMPRPEEAGRQMEIRPNG